MPTKRGNKDAFLAAYKVTGNIAEASKAAGTQRALHYRRIRNDPAYKAAFAAVCAEMSAQRAAEARKVANPRVNGSLRAEIDRLRKRINKLSQDFRSQIRALEAKLAGAQRARSPKQPAQEDALLDQIARGMANKSFSKLSPAHQDAVREVAARIKNTPD